MDTHKISFRKLISTDSLARNSAIVFAGSMCANALSYLYHLIMGRLLGPEGYGELSSLISVLYIFTVPLLVAQTVLVKFISGYKARGEIGSAKSLFLQATKLFAVVSVAVFPIVLLAAPWAASFLHLSNPYALILLYLLLVFSLLSVATAGLLTGYQKFLWVGLMGVIAILVKLMISIPLAAGGVYGVLIAAVIASAVTYGIYFIPLRFIFSVKRAPTKLTRRETFGYAVPTLLTHLGITSLYSTDIILIRHYMNSTDAGLYAAVAILGKIIFYASSAVPMVLFPVASEPTAAGGSTRKLVLSAATAVGAVSVSLALLYSFFPNLIIGLLFGNAYQGASAVLGQFGLFIALFSVGNILAMASLAVGKTGIWFVPIFAGVCQIIGITLFHVTIAQIININIAVAAFFAIGAAAYYVYEKV